jgi:protein arginine kinase activator
MKCHNCDENATVHLTEIIDGQKRAIHLCKKCAEQQHFTNQQELDIPAILQHMIGQHAAETDELSRLACPTCGIKYMEFRSAGRLGCPQDYQVFHDVLLPLLQRHHRGCTHVGKSPRHRRDAALQTELAQLRRQLRDAVEAESYEEAARLRDLIRQKDATDESG